MPKNLTDGTTYAPVVAIPNGNEQRTIASLEPAFQALADRTAATKASIDNGVTRVRAVASIAALKAFAPRTSGDTIHVTGYGFYRFNAASVASSLEPQVIVPDDAQGRWHAVAESMRGAANGVASLDGTAKVPIAQLPAGVSFGVASLDASGRVPDTQLTNRIVGVYYATDAGSNQVATTANTVLAGISLAIPGLLSGDLVMLDGQITVKATGTGAAAVAARFNGTSGGASFFPPVDVANAVPLSGRRYVMPSGGDLTIDVVASAIPSGGNVTMISSLTTVNFLRAMVLRP